MKKRLRLQIAVWLAFVFILSCGLATAQPPIPHHFWGTVTVGDSPALDGTIVTAKIGGVPVESTETFDGGKYTFKVTGNGGDITFFVDDLQAETYEFQSGASTELNLFVPPPGFAVSNLAIDPKEVEIGGVVTIKADVANEGKVGFTYTLTLKINGALEAAKDITLPGGEKGSVTFAVTEDAAGTYNVEVDGLSGTFAVTEPTPSPTPPITPTPSPAVFSVSVLVINPVEVMIGEVVTISVDVANVGDLEGTFEVSLKIDNLTVESEEVTLAAGATETLTFAVVKNVEGTYTVEVAGMKGTFTVKAPVIAPPTIEIASITPEAPASVEVENVAITGLEINVLNLVEGVGITIQELVDMPAEVAIAAPGITYRYLDIVKENITDEDIENVTITFKVEKAWITAENIDLDTIVLRRWDPIAEEWVPLPTTRIGEDDTYFYYSAESPGLSIFAVSGLTLAPAPAEFELSNLVIDPSEVGPGEEVTISVDVTNVGELEGTCTVMLKIDNVVEATEDVTLAGGATETVTFSVSRNVEGTYNVEVDGLTGTFVVTPPPAPSLVPLAISVAGIALLAVILIWLRARREKVEKI